MVIDFIGENWFNCMVYARSWAEMIANSRGAMFRIPPCGQTPSWMPGGARREPAVKRFHHLEKNPMVCVTTWGFSRVWVAMPKTSNPIWLKEVLRMHPQDWRIRLSTVATSMAITAAMCGVIAPTVFAHPSHLPIKLAAAVVANSQRLTLRLESVAGTTGRISSRARCMDTRSAHVHQG